MAILLAEDLLLLLLDDERGDLALRGPVGPGPAAADPAALAAELVLGAAVLVELDLAGAVVRRDGGADPAQQGQVVVTPRAFEPGGPAEEPVLRAALHRLDEALRTAEDQVARLGEGLPWVLAGRLAERGQVHQVPAGGPGAPGPVRWPAADRQREQVVRRALLDVLLGGGVPHPRTRGLLALLTGAHLLELVVPAGSVPVPELYRRGALVADGCWPAAAMERAALRLAPPPQGAPAPTGGGQVGQVVAGVAGGVAVSLAAGFLVGLAQGLAEGLTQQDEA